MGCWGGGLFESVSISVRHPPSLNIGQDHVQDFLIGLSRDVGANICRIGDPDEAGTENDDEPDDYKPIRAEDARKHLNDGNFTRVFEKLKKEGTQDFMINAGHACCILSATAMRVGADISTEQRDYLKSVYKKCGLYKEGIEQMAAAVKDYENGTPYQLINPDTTDQNIQQAFDAARAKAT